jgi:hypothetical protein
MSYNQLDVGHIVRYLAGKYVIVHYGPESLGIQKWDSRHDEPARNARRKDFSRSEVSTLLNTNEMVPTGEVK